MYTRLSDGYRRFTLFRWCEPIPARHSVLSDIRAEFLLHQLAEDSHNAHELRCFLGEEGTLRLARLPDHDVVAMILRDLRCGRLLLAEEQPVQYVGRASRRKESLEPELGATTTWIEFQVVWAEGGQGVAGVEFTVGLPNGQEQTASTDERGLIRIDGLEPGVCELHTSLRTVQLETAIVLAEASPSAPSGYGRSSAGARQLIEFEQRKVKTGDTLDSIARRADMTWQHLAVFNWGTCEVDEINRHLFAEVGCRKKTADGRNYVFDDADDPGIVLLPRHWSRAGLPTAQRHVLRVRPAELPARPLCIRLHIDPAEAEKRHERFRLSSAGGAFEQTKTMADLIKEEEFVDLRFTGVPTRLSYSIELLADGADPVVLAEKIAFAALDGHQHQVEGDRAPWSEDELFALESGFENLGTAERGA